MGITTLRRLPARTYVLLAVALGLACVWAGAEVDNYFLQRQADEVVDGLVEEFRPPGHNAASLVTVHREYLIFGEPIFKLEIFFRASQAAPEEVSQGIEFIYVRGVDGWRLQDSSGCSQEHTRRRGQEAFKNGEVYALPEGAA